MNVPVLREMMRVAFDGREKMVMHTHDIRLRISKDMEQSVSLPYVEWVLKQLEAVGHVEMVADGIWQMLDSYVDEDASIQYRYTKLLGEHKDAVRLP